jgi:hypothetical protein
MRTCIFDASIYSTKAWHPIILIPMAQKLELSHVICASMTSVRYRRTTVLIRLARKFAIQSFWFQWHRSYSLFVRPWLSHTIEERGRNVTECMACKSEVWCYPVLRAVVVLHRFETAILFSCKARTLEAVASHVIWGLHDFIAELELMQRK